LRFATAGIAETSPWTVAVHFTARLPTLLVSIFLSTSFECVFERFWPPLGQDAAPAANAIRGTGRNWCARFSLRLGPRG
jgi:hypothetical protein